MAIDIYNSRRCNYFKCKYWLRNENNKNDDNELIHNSKPDGVFFAREIDEITKDTREYGGGFQIDITSVHLETTDEVKGLDKNALIEYCDELYIVDYVREKHVHKRSEYSCKDSKITTIYMRK